MIMEAMVAFQAFVSAGLDEALPASAQEFLQIDRARAELLLLGKMNIVCYAVHLLFLVAFFSNSGYTVDREFEERGAVRMTIYSIDEIQSRVIPVAKKHRLKAVYLFGSYARGTATPDSDIDLLVDISGTEIKSLLQLSAVLCDFEDALGKRVDLVTTRSLEKPLRMPSDEYFRYNLQKERIEIYAVA